MSDFRALMTIYVQRYRFRIKVNIVLNRDCFNFNVFKNNDLKIN